MRTRSDFPLYQKGVEAYLGSDHKRFLQLRKSKDLSKPESALLTARYHIRERKWDHARKTLASISAQADEFIRAERHFLEATSFFFQGEIKQATQSNLNALSLYEACGDRRGQFLSAYNAMVDYSRMGATAEADTYFKRSQNLADGKSETTLVLRAAACEASRIGAHESACEFIQKALVHKEHLSRQDAQTLDVVAADTYFRAGKMTEALQILETERTSGRNWELARLDFEIAGIESIMNRVDLPKPPVAVMESKEYRLKWQMINALQAGEPNLAQKMWNELIRMFPQRFIQGFQFKDVADQTSIFGVLIQNIFKDKIQSEKKLVLKGFLKKLETELKQSKTPLRKEDLIERIWRKPYQIEFDSRLYKLIERAKKQGLSIDSRNRAYFLKE